MKENERSYDQQADDSKRGHAHCDEINQVYTSVSEEFARIFGYTAKEFLEQFRYLERDIELVYPEDRAILDALYRKTRPGESTVEYRILHRDGSVRLVRETINQILDENGTLVESRSILQEIPG